MDKAHIITHRGLEPNNPSSPGESTFEAFKNHLSRGFGGIEFDPNPTKDGIVVWHDADLKRLSDNKDTRLVKDVMTSEMTSMKYGTGRVSSFDEVMELIRANSGSVNALHLKARFQDRANLATIIDALDKHQDIHNKIIVFDVKPDTARELKSHFPALRLAPSVAHPYDVERFNEAVGGTLITIDQALTLKNEGIIDGVWGDEWDRTNKDGKEKKLYTQENFDLLHHAGLFIALVTPELHATSPGLYGGESHPDARDSNTLFKRITEIIDNGVDYLCTDFPEEVTQIH